jgi:hypothetical protein
MTIDVSVVMPTVEVVSASPAVAVSVDSTAIEVTTAGGPGPAGPAGPQGPPGGSLLSGWWTYSSLTSGPAATGQVRTSANLDTVNEQGTLWLNAVDADGLDWSLVATSAGDTLVLRSAGGETWTLRVDAVVQPGELTVTLISATTTAPKRNQRVQVSLARAAAGGGAVDSVNGQTGVVVLDAADVSAEPLGAIVAHVADPDPHTQYLTEARADAIYLNASGDTMEGRFVAGEVEALNANGDGLLLYPWGDASAQGAVIPVVGGVPQTGAAIVFYGGQWHIPGYAPVVIDSVRPTSPPPGTIWVTDT